MISSSLNKLSLAIFKICAPRKPVNRKPKLTYFPSLGLPSFESHPPLFQPNLTQKKSGGPYLSSSPLRVQAQMVCKPSSSNVFGALSRYLFTHYFTKLSTTTPFQMALILHIYVSFQNWPTQNQLPNTIQLGCATPATNFSPKFRLTILNSSCLTLFPPFRVASPWGSGAWTMLFLSKKPYDKSIFALLSNAAFIDFCV